MRIAPKTLEKLRNIINSEFEYRFGPKLVSFFNDLGIPGIYGKGFPSRSAYTDQCIDRINGHASNQ